MVAGRPLIQGTRTALGTDHSAQLASAILVQFFLLEPIARLGQILQIELRHQLGAVATGPDDVAIGAGASQQHQRIDQQGLARARLAADHGQPGAKGDIGFFDDGKVADVEGGQHEEGRQWVREIVRGGDGGGVARWVGFHRSHPLSCILPPHTLSL